MTLSSSSFNTQACWNDIGITGDRSCPELVTHTHCRNCPVYFTVGRSLLERDIPDGYTQEWTTLLATPQAAMAPSGGATGSTTATQQGITVVIFRIRSEWLALPAHLIKEVTPSSSIHTIPHRSNQILLGLVNIRGELQMCVSLAHLLMLDTAPPGTVPLATVVQSITAPRLMIVEREGDCWAFLADDIYGVQRFPRTALKPAPANVTKSTNTYTRGLLSWRDTHVSLLDDELLFYILNQRAL